MSMLCDEEQERAGLFAVQSFVQFCAECQQETEHRRWVRANFCMVCGDNRHEAMVREEQAQEQERRRRVGQEMLAQTGVHEEVMGKALHEAPASLRDFLLKDNFFSHISSGHNLVFLGNVGTGKTTLAVAVAMQALKHGFKAHYTKAYDLVAANGGYPFCSLLIIDEIERGVRFFGSQPCDEDQLVLFKVAETRKNAGLSTLILSNHSGDELRLRLGEATYDRLRHNALGLTFGAKSFRTPLKV